MLPSGNITFLLTDVESSTRLLGRLGDDFTNLLAEHFKILRSAITAHDGAEVAAEGDGLFAVFGDASRAIAACLDAQRGLAAYPWPPDRRIQVRMGLHTGIARPTPDGTYVALAVNEAARISAAAHGGQVLMSADTARMVRHFLPDGASLTDRGSFMLRGFDEPERIYQLAHQDLDSSFPPLRASPAVSHNLPDMRMLFVGRDADLKGIDDRLAAGRLVEHRRPGRRRGRPDWRSRPWRGW